MTRQEENELGMKVWDDMEKLWSIVMRRLEVRYDTSQPTPYPLVGEQSSVELWQKYDEVHDLVNDLFGEEESVN